MYAHTEWKDVSEKSWFSDSSSFSSRLACFTFVRAIEPIWEISLPVKKEEEFFTRRGIYGLRIGGEKWAGPRQYFISGQNEIWIRKFLSRAWHFLFEHKVCRKCPKASWNRTLPKQQKTFSELFSKSCLCQKLEYVTWQDNEICRILTLWTSLGVEYIWQFWFLQLN